jgi:Ca2+-transporting ATPase
MGRRGTDVAREAARLVLLDDDFGELVATLRQGRRIFDNLRKALSYTLAVHMPIVGMSLLPALLGQPLMLLPALIVFYELVIDPACSIVFEAEPEEPGLMTRPPRQPQEPLFGGRRFAWALAQGALVWAVTAALWGWSVLAAWPEDRARALVFALMVGGNLALLTVNRGLNRPFWHGLARANRTFWWVVAAAIGGVLLVTQWPPLAALFHLAPLGVEGWALVLAATVATLLLLELLRVAWRLPTFRPVP